MNLVQLTIRVHELLDRADPRRLRHAAQLATDRRRSPSRSSILAVEPNRIPGGRVARTTMEVR